MTTEEWSSSSLPSLKKSEAVKANTSDDEDGALARRKERIRRRKRTKNNNVVNGNDNNADSGVNSHDNVAVVDEEGEPLFHEDVVEGFAFVSCQSLEQLQLVSRWSEAHGGRLPDPFARLDICDDLDDAKAGKEAKGGKKKKRKRRKQAQPTDQQQEQRQEGVVAARTIANNNNNTVSVGGSSSEKGYLCDSDSDDEKGSDNGIGDLFTTKKACPNGLSQSSTPLEESNAHVSNGSHGAVSAATSTKMSCANTTAVPTASSSQSSSKRSVLYRPYSTSPPPTRPAANITNVMAIPSLTSASLTASSTTTSATRAPLPSSWSSSLLGADVKGPASITDLRAMAPFINSSRLPSHFFQPRMPNPVVDSLGLVIPPLTPSLGSTATPSSLYNPSNHMFRDAAGKIASHVDSSKLFPPPLTPSISSISETAKTTPSTTSSSSSRAVTNGGSHLNPSSGLKKGGKWNAMHVRIAWEIHNHQRKTKGKDSTSSSSSSLAMTKSPSLAMTKSPAVTRSSVSSPRISNGQTSKEIASPLLTPRAPNPPRLPPGGVVPPDLLRSQFGLLRPPTAAIAAAAAAANASVPKHFPPVPTTPSHFPTSLDPLSRLSTPNLTAAGVSAPTASPSSPFGGLGNLRGSVDDLSRRHPDRDRVRRHEKKDLSNGHRSRSPRHSPAIVDKKIGGNNNSALDMRLYNGSTSNGNEVSVVSEKEGNVTICHDATSANVTKRSSSKRQKLSPSDNIKGCKLSNNSSSLTAPFGASSLPPGRPPSVADPFTAMLTSLFSSGVKANRDRSDSSSLPRFPGLAPLSAPFLASSASGAVPSVPAPPLNSASGLLGSMANKLLPQPPSSLFLYNGLPGMPPMPYPMPGLLTPPGPRLATPPSLPGASSAASQPLFNPFPPR